jgi:hypothetical protein
VPDQAKFFFKKQLVSRSALPGNRRRQLNTGTDTFYLLLLAKAEWLQAARAGDGCVPTPEQQKTKKNGQVLWTQN